MDRLKTDGSLKQVQERVYLGSCAEMTKRQALTEASRAMATLNDRKRVIQAQISFGEVLENFILKADNLATSAQGKYLSLIKNHVGPH